MTTPPDPRESNGTRACTRTEVNKRTPPCECATEECEHSSDCAVHNEPAEPNGECDCRVSMTPAELRALPGAHYSDGRRYSRISKAWIFAEDWNDREEAAFQREIADERALDIVALQSRLESAEKKVAWADSIISTRHGPDVVVIEALTRQLESAENKLREAEAKIAALSKIDEQGMGHDDATAAIAHHVHEIQVLCDAFGYDPSEWLQDEVANECAALAPSATDERDRGEKK